MSGKYHNILFLIIFILVSSTAAVAAPDDRRAVLGINIASGSANGGPAEGVTVVGVTPGGPAAEAGIRAGDVLVAIGGEALTDGSRRASNRKLLRFMETVNPGDEIEISYLRDGAVKDVRLKAGEIDLRDMPPNFPFIGDLERFGEQFRSHMEGRSGTFWRHHGVFAGMELVALTEALGEYFGTAEGLLVIRAPDDDALELRDGDVIQQIGGRVPRDPAHAMRILRSYEPGEKLVVDIVRKERKKELVIRLPEAKESERSPADGTRSQYWAPRSRPLSRA